MPTAYFQSLPERVRANLSPYIGVMQEAAQRNKIPVDLLISIAAKESGGVNAVGDKSQKDKAYGIYQVRYKDYWLGGADPTDTTAATGGLAKRLRSVLDDCNGDPACVHFKYMSGPGQGYTPANVQRISRKFPHVAPRLAEVHDALGLRGFEAPIIPLAPPVVAKATSPITPSPQYAQTSQPRTTAWFAPDIVGGDTGFDYSSPPRPTDAQSGYYDALYEIFNKSDQ